MPDPTGTAHIAGLPIRAGSHLRQRCGWCNVILIDHDLTAIAVPIGQDPTPATWPVGADVVVEHGDPDGRPAAITSSVTYLLDPTPGRTPDEVKLPPHACARLDPELTR